MTRCPTRSSRPAGSDAQAATVDGEPPAESVEPDNQERRRLLSCHSAVESVDGGNVIQVIAPAPEQPEPAVVGEDAPHVQG